MGHAVSAAAGMSGFVHTADGTSLFYRDWGTGKPIVFVASWVMPSESWSYQMAALSEQGFRCIAYDRRGHGRSSDPGRGYDFDTLADDLAAVLEALDLRGFLATFGDQVPAVWPQSLCQRTSWCRFTAKSPKVAKSPIKMRSERQSGVLGHSW
jgi:alpha-beta hydrolase superfamily lysophospholipase